MLIWSLNLFEIEYNLNIYKSFFCFFADIHLARLHALAKLLCEVALLYRVSSF